MRSPSPSALLKTYLRRGSGTGAVTSMLKKSRSSVPAACGSDALGSYSNIVAKQT